KLNPWHTAHDAIEHTRRTREGEPIHIVEQRPVGVVGTQRGKFNIKPTYHILIPYALNAPVALDDRPIHLRDGSRPRTPVRIDDEGVGRSPLHTIDGTKG